MTKRRKHRPEIGSLTEKNPESEICCWFCGNTRNAPESRYGGLCMSCFFEFQEDDIEMELWGMEVMA